MDEAFASRFPGGPASPPGKRPDSPEDLSGAGTPKLDPPEVDQEPPSLTMPGASFDDNPASLPHGTAPPHLGSTNEPYIDETGHSYSVEPDYAYNGEPDHAYGEPLHSYNGEAHHSYDGEPKHAYHGESEHAYPDPGFQDPEDSGFNDPGATPLSEPSIGADGFFEDGYYEPRPQDGGFGDPYFEHQGHPAHPSSNMEMQDEQFHTVPSPTDEQFRETSSPPGEHFHEEQFQDEQYHHDEYNPRSAQQQQFDGPQGPYTLSGPSNDDIYSGSEEKKIGTEDLDDENGEDGFIAIKRHGYQLGSDGPSPRSMVSDSMDSRSYQSSALKGAQDILRKNRRRRVEM